MVIGCINFIVVMATKYGNRFMEPVRLYFGQLCWEIEIYLWHHLCNQLVWHFTNCVKKLNYIFMKIFIDLRYLCEIFFELVETNFVNQLETFIEIDIKYLSWLLSFKLILSMVSADIIWRINLSYIIHEWGIKISFMQPIGYDFQENKISSYLDTPVQHFMPSKGMYCIILDLC